MATLVLSAVGAAVGSGFGGTVLGLSGAVIGRAVGATIGQAIDRKIFDQRVIGSGSEAVDQGRIDRLRVMTSAEGAPIAQIWGRQRIAGQVIWSTRFLESVETTTVGGTSGGGKGGGGGSAPSQTINSYSYSISVAIALCQGPILRIGRIWADGNEIAPDQLNLRVYTGGMDQLPDPRIEAVEGAGQVPAFRGTAYVVVEDLALGQFGNRMPQLSFEVIRPAQNTAQLPEFSKIIPGVAMIPGTGEYALATTPVHYVQGLVDRRSANMNTISGQTDFVTALQDLSAELPNSRSVALVVSWFGDDLRCGHCTVRPKVEQNLFDGETMAWTVSGINRAQAAQIARLNDRPVYGGTPTDQSVIEAITALKSAGQAVTFYPFILMDQLAGNGLPDPYGGAEQAALPWRGRITGSIAPGLPGSDDKTAQATADLDAFFGTAQPSQFSVTPNGVSYSGSDQWRYRRFILHYAHLCAAAGGVESFCIGSEMRGVTQLRGANHSFPGVTRLRNLAADVRAILGPNCKISYAADWSEYFGYHADENLYFHLDPLWGDANIDYIGIDNYMPLADWRDGDTHLDATFHSIYNLEYLRRNIAGGEGFDWYYPSPEAEAAQARQPIIDGDWGEDWAFRYKDLRGWWQNFHHNRINGQRSATPTSWQPASKPFRFTEYGCAAIDKGANQPNRFLDPKSSESGAPKYSNGRRDDLMQLTYYQVMYQHWSDPAQNPISPIYNDRMLDFSKSHAWAWDARPFPDFPRNTSLWSDGENYDRGHWLNGRTSNQHLAAVIQDIAQTNGVTDLDLSRCYGLVRGYVINDVTTARAALQPLLTSAAHEVIERDGQLRFQSRHLGAVAAIDSGELVRSDQLESSFETTRATLLDETGRLRLGYVAAEDSYGARITEVIFPDQGPLALSHSELPLVLTDAEAGEIAQRWMAESRIARDTARFALPKSKLDLGAGDRVEIMGQLYRIDRIEQAQYQLIEATRSQTAPYRPAILAQPPRAWRAIVPDVPVLAQFLELPLLTGDEIPQAPYIIAAAKPWPGQIAVWSSVTQDDYALNTIVTQSATLGVTETPLMATQIGLWDHGPALRVKLATGSLSSATILSVLGGANTAVIGDAQSNQYEVIQYRDAVLVAPDTYELRHRLRGQAGSDATMAAIWPVGSQFILINAALRQINLPLSARGLLRNYRIGRASAGVNNGNVVQQTRSFDGIGLRPYRVAHLRARALGNDIHVTWTRRTRIDGDSWDGVDVPLSETAETYTVKLVKNNLVLREVVTSGPSFTYSADMQLADGAGVEISVAQRSDAFGNGPFQTLPLTPCAVC